MASLTEIDYFGRPVLHIGRVYRSLSTQDRQDGHLEFTSLPGLLTECHTLGGKYW